MNSNNNGHHANEEKTGGGGLTNFERMMGPIREVAQKVALDYPILRLDQIGEALSTGQYGHPIAYKNTVISIVLTIQPSGKSGSLMWNCLVAFVLPREPTNEEQEFKIKSRKLWTNKEQVIAQRVCAHFLANVGRPGTRTKNLLPTAFHFCKDLSTNELLKVKPGKRETPETF